MLESTLRTGRRPVRSLTMSVAAHIAIVAFLFTLGASAPELRTRYQNVGLTAPPLSAPIPMPERTATPVRRQFVEPARTLVEPAAPIEPAAVAHVRPAVDPIEIEIPATPQLEWPELEPPPAPETPRAGFAEVVVTARNGKPRPELTRTNTGLFAAISSAASVTDVQSAAIVGVFEPTAPKVSLPVRASESPSTGSFVQAGYARSETADKPAARISGDAGFGSRQVGRPAGRATGPGRVVREGEFGGSFAVAQARPPADRAPVAVDGFRSVAAHRATAQRVDRDTPPASQTALEILSKPRPRYTEEGRRSQIEGEVAIEALFGATGEIRVLRVLRSLGYGLDECARQAVEAIEFRPASRGGQPVDSVAVVRITFQLAY